MESRVQETLSWGNLMTIMPEKRILPSLRAGRGRGWVLFANKGQGREKFITFENLFS
jgi:hypothetical protein